MTPPVSIIVLCHDRWALTRRCLQALRRSTPPELYELLAYDNASSDGTFRGLERAACDWPQLRPRRNERNLSFAEGINRGMRHARGRRFLWLNNDAVPGPGWLQGLLRAADGAAAAGPMTDNQAPLHQISAPFRTRARGRAEETPFLGGFCLLVARAAAEAAGGLDERFVWGWEDMDYCVRLRQAGGRLVLARDVFVRHDGSRTLSGLAAAERRRLDVGNRQLLAAKWLGADPWRRDLEDLVRRMPAPWQKTSPKASILVACREWPAAKGLLGAARRSARGTDCEVLAADLSPDGLLTARLERLAREWPQLRAVGPWGALSLAAGLNRAAAEARTDYLAFAGAAREPGWLAELLGTARSRPDAGLVRTPAARTAPGTTGFLTPRALFERLGGLDERFAGALCLADYGLRVEQHGRPVVETDGGRGSPPAAPDEPAGDRGLAVDKWLGSDRRREEFQERLWREVAPRPKVSIIVLCRGAWRISRLCLESARRNAGGIDYELLAACYRADGRSAPGLRAMAKTWPQLRVLGTFEPTPCAHAVNLAVSAACGENLLLLSNNALLSPGALGAMLQAADQARTAAVVAPRCRGSDLRWQRSPNGTGAAADSHPVKYVRDLCVLIPRRALAALGPFDDRFENAYWVEDYCHRAQQRGCQVLIVSNALVRRQGARPETPSGNGRRSANDLQLLFGKWQGHPLFAV